MQLYNLTPNQLYLNPMQYLTIWLDSKDTLLQLLMAHLTVLLLCTHPTSRSYKAQCVARCTECKQAILLLSPPNPPHYHPLYCLLSASYLQFAWHTFFYSQWCNVARVNPAAIVMVLFLIKWWPDHKSKDYWTFDNLNTKVERQH